MEIRNTYGLTAPAEVVFDVLTDPDRTPRWLPGAVTAEPAGEGQWRLVDDGGSERYQVSTSTSQLRLDWRATDPSEISGTAQVRDGASGGSEVEVVVRVPATAPVDQVRVGEVATELVRRLQVDVSDNFNAG